MKKEKTQKEKLEEEIANLVTDIKNTEYDLAGLFKGNTAIEEKLRISKEQLNKKKQLLAELTGKTEEDALEQIKKFEEEVTEKGEKPISDEQEKIEKEEIEEEIEKELTGEK